MNSETLKQVEEIYHAALEIPLAKREAFFKESCGADENLRREVESLLAFENTFDKFIDAPPESLAAEMFAEQENRTSLINREIGHYKIKQLLGRGGMGKVFLAEDTRLDRKITLKFLPENFAQNAERMRRFVQEAKSASALNHPNIITIYEIGEVEDQHFIAAEYIEGETLRAHSKGGAMPLQSALETAIQIASALHAAHTAGIVHRDIKPENVMIRPDGWVKILDFGIAKPTEQRKEIAADEEAAITIKAATTPGTIIGTAAYMSPEQARGKAVDARSDIFSFGLLLYEMLSGRQAFEGDNSIDVIGAILYREPLPLIELLPGLPREIERIIGKTLKKDREERYQTAKDLLFDLKDVRQNLEFEKKLGNSISDDRLSNSAGGFDTRNTDNAKTLILETSATAKDFSPAAEKTIHTTSSAEYIAGEVKNHKFGLLGALAVLVVALAAIGYLTYFRSEPINSIAVLPFVNVGDDRSNDYLSDGLSENLINNLSRLPQLKVIARTSSFRFRGENIDIQDAAKKLGVAAILTGRVVRRVDDLQISVELINAADNTRIWGEIYNRQVSGALNVPDEIAHDVAEKLQLNLSGAQERQMAKQITDNPQAYQFHLNGVFFRRKNGTENIRKAIEYQKQAIALDANFTRAYVELSINYGNLVDIGAISPKEGVPPARAAAEKALALDETIADAYYNIGRIRKYEFEWREAETAFKRAIELNPNLAAAHTLYAEYLSQLGRFDEAQREIKLAQELDPLRTGLVGNEGSIYYYARQYDEAIVKKQIHVNSAPENPFAHLGLANAYAAKGQYTEALLSYQTSIKLEETTSALIYLGRLYALTGRSGEAAAILGKLNTTEKYVSPTELAILYAARGDREKAFASLEKGYAERDFQLTEIKVEPGYDPLRDDSRFQDILRRLNFPQ
ncbi:MAG: protein kinase [Pyrinomonadaceae bacterium]|nr:protein kinase [Pyrinomonadaceae bacterium]